MPTHKSIMYMSEHLDAVKMNIVVVYLCASISEITE